MFALKAVVVERLRPLRKSFAYIVDNLEHFVLALKSIAVLNVVVDSFGLKTFAELLIAKAMIDLAKHTFAF